MTTAADGAPTSDLFISYTGADHTWAEWIAWQLKKTVMLPPICNQPDEEPQTRIKTSHPGRMVAWPRHGRAQPCRRAAGSAGTGGMPIDILAEAEAVAAARWRATEPSPGRSTEPCPPVRPAAVPDSAAAIADPRRSAHIRRFGDRPRGGAVPRGVGAGDEADPWLTRQLLRLDERLLGMLVVVAMLALIGTTVLIAVASR